MKANLKTFTYEKKKYSKRLDDQEQKIKKMDIILQDLREDKDRLTK
jgi:hypothetical protein